MKHRHLVISVALGALLSGCVVNREAIKLDANADLVNLRRTKPVKKCEYKGKIIALEDRQSRIMFGKKATVNQSAKNAMRNKALALSANYVYLDPSDDKDNTGYAYYCPDLPMPVREKAAISRPYQASPPLPGRGDSIRRRLLELKGLFKDGLIDAEEYKRQKERILNDL